MTRWWTRRRHRAQHVCPNPRIRARIAGLPAGQDVIFDFDAETLYLTGKYGHYGRPGAAEWWEILRTTDGLVIEYSLPSRQRSAGQ